MSNFTSPMSGYYELCQVCNFQYQADQMQMRWDGLLVCDQDWEEKHPSLTLPLAPKETFPHSRNPRPDTLASFSDRYPNGITWEDL